MMQIPSLILFSPTAFATFLANTFLVFLLIALSTHHPKLKHSILMDIITAFVTFVYLTYYTLVIVANYSIATKLDKALIGLLWMVIMTFYAYRLAFERFERH